jgi:hypothetical protein
MSAEVTAVLQYGALGLLLLLFVGAALGFRMVFPASRDFLTGLVVELRELRTGQIEMRTSLGAKIDAVSAKVDGQAALSLEQVRRHVDDAAERVADVVRDRASHVVDEAREAVRMPTGEHAALPMERDLVREPVRTGRVARLPLPGAPGR